MGPRAGARLRAHKGRIGQADRPGTVRPESQNQGVSRRFLIRPRGGPVVYASRSMNETERRYAQIEKEALAVTWACEKFSDYVLGRFFAIESDHKPLIPLLNTKCLNNMPPRILRFRLRMSRFTYIVNHVPGKLLYTADTLSRAPTDPLGGEEGDVELFVNAVVIPALPAGQSRLESYRQAQAEDNRCRQVMEYCNTGWSEREDRPVIEAVLESQEFPDCV